MARGRALTPVVVLGRRFENALALMTRLHRLQGRKNEPPTPYIAHLLAVTALVLEYGGDEDEAIAALLHDAVEDQGGHETLEEIRKRFGEGVANTVDGCTDAYVQPKPPWRERKEMHVRELREASGSVRLITAADKVHNIESTLEDLRRDGPVVLDRFRGGRDGTYWYYESVHEVLREKGGGPLVDRLGRGVAEMRSLLDQPRNQP